MMKNTCLTGLNDYITHSGFSVFLGGAFEKNTIPSGFQGERFELSSAIKQTLKGCHYNHPARGTQQPKPQRGDITPGGQGRDIVYTQGTTIDNTIPSGFHGERFELTSTARQTLKGCHYNQPDKSAQQPKPQRGDIISLAGAIDTINQQRPKASTYQKPTPKGWHYTQPKAHHTKEPQRGEIIPSVIVIDTRSQQRPKASAYRKPTPKGWYSSQVKTFQIRKPQRGDIIPSAKAIDTSSQQWGTAPTYRKPTSAL